MNQVASVTQPLIKHATGKFFVEAKFQIYMRVKWTVRFSEQPAFPIRVLLAEAGGPLVKPLLPLHIFVFQHFRRDAGVDIHESPTFFVHVPFLLDVHDLANSPKPDEIPDSEVIRLAAMLSPY